MFVGSSVIVSILSKEPDAASLAERIGAASCVTSALVVLESAMRLSTKLRIDPVVVGRMIQVLLDEAQIGFVPIEAATGFLAIETFAAYGKGQGHPAQLNLADCLSYACAKRTSLPLLYKGRDFADTDMA